jgi:hypothetical protein
MKECGSLPRALYTLYSETRVCVCGRNTCSELNVPAIASALSVLLEDTNSCFLVGQDSSVDIPTRYVLDGSGIESQWGGYFSASVQTGPVAHLASHTMCTGSSLA